MGTTGWGKRISLTNEQIAQSRFRNVVSVRLGFRYLPPTRLAAVSDRRWSSNFRDRRLV